MAEPAIWLELLKLAVTTAATGAVGYWAIQVSKSQRNVAASQARTATLQRLIAEAKLSLDLFEHRYAVFEKVWEFLSDSTKIDRIRIDGTISLHQDLSNLIPKAQFLFGGKIAEYMREAHRKRIDLDATYRRIRANGRASDEDEKQLTELERWFHEEASNCFKRFGDYLNFAQWKVDPIEHLVARASANALLS